MLAKKIRNLRNKFILFEDRVMKRDIDIIVFGIKSNYEYSNYTPIKNYNFIFNLDNEYLNYFLNSFNNKETELFIKNINSCIITNNKLDKQYSKKFRKSLFLKQSEDHKKMLSIIINNKLKG